MANGTATARRVSRRRPLLIALAVAAVLVGGVAAVGGFAAVPRRNLPELAAGTTFDNGLYAVTVASAVVESTDPTTGRAFAGPRIVARARVLYRGDSTALRAYDWLLPEVRGVRRAAVELRGVRDGTISPPVQPGLPIDLYYSWPVPPDSPLSVGDRVRIGVYERYEAENLPLEGITTVPVLVSVVRTDRP